MLVQIARHCTGLLELEISCSEITNKAIYEIAKHCLNIGGKITDNGITRLYS